MEKNSTDSVNQEEFTRQKHIQYLSMVLKSSSKQLATVECHKIFNLYFLLTGLDMVDGLDKIDIPKQQIIDYIYNQQCTAFTETNEKCFGFLGGPYLGFNIEEQSDKPLSFDSSNPHYTGNLIYTFPAICTLVLLGDDLSRVNKKAIIKGIKQLQLDNGCFLSTFNSKEYDLRMMYAACAISYLLNDWSGIDIQKACDFILSCQSYDYAFGFLPDGESHGAATFLAVASLTLMKKEDLISNKGQIISWCLARQYGGFQGRINKFMDSCYSFWVGGALQILGFEGFINKDEISAFLLICQAPPGGLSKVPEMDFADPVHTLHSLFGLAINGKFSLKPIKALLNISEETYKKWEKIGI